MTTYYLNVSLPVWFEADNDDDARGIADELGSLYVQSLLGDFRGNPRQADAGHVTDFGEWHNGDLRPLD